MLAPGPKNNPIKNFLEYRKSPIDFFQYQINEYGKIVHLNMMGKNVLLVSSPTGVEYVLATNANNYLKGRTTQKLSKIMGRGLITNEGKSWRNNNKLIRKNFSIKKINELSPLFISHGERLADEICQSRQVNIVQKMHQVSLDIIAESLFQQKQNDPYYKDLIADIDFFLNYIVSLTRSINPLKSILPSPSNLQFKRKIKRLDSYINKIINDRKKVIKQGSSEQHDLLSLLISKDSLGEMDDQQIRDEVVTLLLAGHETISNALSWSFISLAKNPTHFEGLRQEATEFCSGNHLHEDMLSLNSKAKNVFSESMRLYPPVWVFMRETIKEDHVDGFKIPKGSMVILPPYYTHRDSDLWEAPNTFNPDRFINLDNPNKGINGIRYLPFGHGPRTCIGNHMAYLEAQIIMLCILKKCRLSLDNIEDQEMGPGITLSPLNNHLLTVTPY